MITGLSSVVFGFLYARRIWQRKAVATFSMWLIFLVACLVSLGAYLMAENKDWKSGILNVVDVFYVSGVLFAIIMRAEQKARFEAFEKWYLIAAGLIVVLGMIVRSAWCTHLLTQVLMSVAYIPMYHRMYVEKKKIDSYFAYLSQIFTSAVALYPALYDGNALSATYACRSLFFGILTTSIMLYYQYKVRRATLASQ
jgi:hypothetical protein